MKKDKFIIAGRNFKSRLIVGTGKYKSMSECAKAIKLSGAEIVTVAVRRVNISDKNNVSVNEFIINIKKILDSRSILITLPYFLLKFLTKIPFLGRYFLKLYGQHEISNQNVQKTYKIEFFDTYSCISRINNE